MTDESQLPESDPRNPLDLILRGGPHDRQTLRRSQVGDRKVLLLSTYPDGRPSAPFFAEYRPTDHADPYTGLRVWRYIGTGIDGSTRTSNATLTAKKKGNHPYA